MGEEIGLWKLGREARPTAGAGPGAAPVAEGVGPVPGGIHAAGGEATRGQLRPSEWIPRVRCVVGTVPVSCAARNGSGSAAMSEAADPCNTRATATKTATAVQYGFKSKSKL